MIINEVIPQLFAETYHALSQIGELDHRRHTCQEHGFYAAGALRNALTACNTLEGTKRFSGAMWISARNGQRTS